MGRLLTLLKRTTSLAAARIGEITTAYGGWAAVVPQAYYDAMAVEGADSNMHPHLGPYTHVAVQDGLWSDPDTWDVAEVPDEDAVVNVSTYTVTYDLESDVKIKDIHVSGAGTFQWATNVDTRLWVDTLMCHGTYIQGTVDDPILNSETEGKPRSEIVFWSSEAPLATVRLGLVTMGPVRMHGQQKSDWLNCSGDMLTGATTITLEGVSSSNWRAGDSILILATSNAGTDTTDAQYTGPTSGYIPLQNSYSVRSNNTGFQLSHDEVRTIVSISGDTITLNAALSYDHVRTTDTLPHGQSVVVKAGVAMLSHSIRMRSEVTTPRASRAHAMFMHNDDIDVRYVEAKNMGRTDIDLSLVVPDGTIIRATNGGTALTDATNVRGRYPLHLHGTGPYFGRYQAVLKGCSVWSPTAEVPTPGWAIVHHNCRAAIENCVSYNTRGAGFVSELGNEIGQWVNNSSAWNRGDGFSVDWGSRAENFQNHNGHQGCAYEQQARQILCHGNRASSSRYGWFFMQQDVAQLSRIPDQFSLRYLDPLTLGAADGTGGVFLQDTTTYGIEQAQIPDFNDNVSFGCRIGFGVAHRQFTDRSDTTPMIAHRNHCIKTAQAFQLINYSFYYSFYDALWTGLGSGTAFSGGTISWQFNFVNHKLKDFTNGFADSGMGLNYNGNWIDIGWDNVTNHFVQGSYTHTGSTDPTIHPYYNAGYGFNATAINTPVGGYTFTPRTWAAASEADLPLPFPNVPDGLQTEPLPGTPKPYFQLSGGAVTTVTPSGVNNLSISGLLVDRVGVREWPSHVPWAGTALTELYDGNDPRTNQYARGTLLVQRNGCFNDSGTWKSRLWFNEHDRFTGEYFRFYVDLTLSGFDSGFLATYTVDPSEPLYELPLKPESIEPPRPLVADTTAPTITSASSITQKENLLLAQVLTANDVAPTFTIDGGADAALFEIVKTSGVSTLRFIGDAIPDYETPLDANTDNVYEVGVKVKDAAGNYSSPVTHTLTITDEFDDIVSPFTDNFNRANGTTLDASIYWSRSGGFAGLANTLSNNLRTTGTVSGDRGVYRSPDTGSNNHYAQGTNLNNFNGCYLGLSITDEDNWIAVRQSSSSVVTVSKRVAGTTSTVTTFSNTYASGQVLRAEISGGTVTVKVNGSSIGSIAVTSPPPVASRAGLVIVGIGQSTVYGEFESGAL